MNKPSIPRRTVLRGAAGAALALPWLPSLTARAATAPIKRFVVMFSPNGTLPGAWTPTGTETAFTLGPILAPLAPHQADLVVVAGLNQQGGGGDGHQNGIGGMLTGTGLNPGPFAGQGAAPAGWAMGPSVDQRIAAEMGAPTKYRSLELGVQVKDADNWGRMIYRTANQPLPPNDDPADVYARVFTDLHTDPAVLVRQLKRKKSILDAVAGEYGRVSGRVGAADRMRLDAHATAVREIEQRLVAQSVSSNATCHDPAVRAVAKANNDAFPDVGSLQLDMLAMALACDITRVASLQWSRSVSQVRFTWLPMPVPEGHHDLSHRSDDDADAVAKLTRINAWYASQLAGLITRLKAIPEGDGTVFDNTLILWANELAKGNTHSRFGAGYVLAGRAGGALRTGRFLDYTGQSIPHNNLLVSLLNLMDVPDKSFGKTDWCTGPLAGLI
jgi:hypothetical protein